MNEYRERNELEKIQESVSENANALNFITNITQPSYDTTEHPPKFIIARKWNSWYPSYFNVKGGGYILDFGEDKIAIDPGFQFSGILRELRINPLNISKIFLTHLHTDHFAGLIEFLTLRHELLIEESKNNEVSSLIIYANESSFKFFKTIIEGNVFLKQITPNSSLLIKSIAKEGRDLCTVEITNAYHREQGGYYSSVGLIFTILTEKKNFRIGLMSDTDGSKKYLKQYVKTYSNVDVLIPHVGTIEKRKTPNGEKHLYLEGLTDILTKIDTPSFIIIGEFGLEMGSLSSMIDGVTSYITSRYREIFRKTLLLLKDKDKLEIGCTFVNASKNYLEDFNQYRLMRFMVDMVETIEGAWWDQRKSLWAKNYPNYIHFRQPPKRYLKMLDSTDYYEIRRIWANFNYCQPELQPLLTEINRITLNLISTGFNGVFIDDVHKIKWEENLNNLRISLIRFFYLRIITKIKPRLFTDKELSSKEKDERAKAIVDQLFTTLILFIVSIKESNLIIENDKSRSYIDYRSELSNYFTNILQRPNQIIISGEYGTTLKFIDERIEILAECSRCNRRKFYSSEIIKNPYYDKNKDKIRIKVDLCQKCKDDEEKYGYSDDYPQSAYEEEEYYRQIEHQEQEERMRWNYGEYRFLLEGEPKKYKNFLTNPPQDLEDLLQSHLYLIDKSSFNSHSLERIKTYGLMCNHCKGISFRVCNDKQYLNLVCSNPECEQLISIDLKKQIEFSRHYSDENNCELCQNRHFNLSLGFEYIKQGENHPDIDGYNKIHLASYCLQCENKETLCCHLDEEGFKFIVDGILITKLKNLKDLNQYIGVSRNEKICNLLIGFGDKDFKERILKMGRSLDFSESSAILGILQENLLGKQKTLHLLLELLLTQNNLVQALIMENLIENEGFNEIKTKILPILNPFENEFMNQIYEFHNIKKSLFRWPHLKSKKIFNFYKKS